MFYCVVRLLIKTDRKKGDYDIGFFILICNTKFRTKFSFIFKNGVVLTLDVDCGSTFSDGEVAPM